MSSENFVDALHGGKNLEAEDAFKSAMQDKIGAALETNRREVANSFVKTVLLVKWMKIKINTWTQEQTWNNEMT